MIEKLFFYFCIIINFSECIFRFGNIYYETWRKTNKENCTLLNVTFHTNYTLKHDERIELNINGDNFNCDVVYNSTFGVCYFYGIFHSDKTTFNFYIKSENESRLVLSSIKSTFTEDHPFHITVSTIKINSAIIQFFQPWEDYCYLPIAQLNENCSSENSDSCSSKSLYDLDSSSMCVTAKENRTVLDCERKLTDLTPDTKYTYKLRFTTSIKDNPTSWSMWSNVLTFRTLDIVPTESPQLKCDYDDKNIQLHWRVPDSATDIDSLYYKVSFNGKEELVQTNANKHHTYQYKVPDSSSNSHIYLTACSNSGCASSNSISRCVIDHRKQVSRYYWFIILIPVAISIILIMMVLLRRKSQSRNLRNIELVSPRTPPLTTTPVIKNFQTANYYDRLQIQNSPRSSINSFFRPDDLSNVSAGSI